MDEKEAAEIRQRHDQLYWDWFDTHMKRDEEHDPLFNAMRWVCTQLVLMERSFDATWDELARMPELTLLDTYPDPLSRQQVAKVLHVHPATLAKWAMTNQGPPLYKNGTRCEYRRSELLQWIADQQE